MTTELNIGADLHLDADYVGGGTFGLLGKKGAGKSFTTRVLAEEFWTHKVPFVLVDPMGANWGLRSSADGRSEGIPVPIFGGDHADAPLERTAGAVMADLVMDGLSMILDLSSLGSRAAERQFGLAFFERLYRTNDRLVHVLLDEADLFAPQRPAAGDQPLLGVTENIVRRGRNRGIAITLISQRPAVVNKDVLTQVDGLWLLRITSPQDRDAARTWMEAAGEPDQVREVTGSLATLANGEAWVWIPELRVFQRTQVRLADTYDSSPTRKRGDRPTQPKGYADVDLDQIRTKISASIERAEAADPKALRHRIAELERDLQAERDRPAPQPVIERVEVPVLAPEIMDQLQALLDPAAGLLGEAQDTMAKHRTWVEQQLSGLPQEGKRGQPTPRSSAPRPVQASSTTVRAAVAGSSTHRDKNPSPGRETRPTPGEGPRPLVASREVSGLPLTPAFRRILNALAMLEQIGVPSADRTQLALLAGSKPTSGAYKNNLGALRNQAGLVSYPTNGTVALTDAGRQFADVTSAPQTTDELHQLIHDLVEPAQWRILAQLIDHYPQAMTRDDLATHVGVPITSGAYKNNLGRLRSLGLIDYPQQGLVVGLPILFLGAPS